MSLSDRANKLIDSLQRSNGDHFTAVMALARDVIGNRPSGSAIFSYRGHRMVVRWFSGVCPTIDIARELVAPTPESEAFEAAFSD